MANKFEAFGCYSLFTSISLGMVFVRFVKDCVVDGWMRHSQLGKIYVRFC